MGKFISWADYEKKLVELVDLYKFGPRTHSRSEAELYSLLQATKLPFAEQMSQLRESIKHIAQSLESKSPTGDFAQESVIHLTTRILAEEMGEVETQMRTLELTVRAMELNLFVKGLECESIEFTYNNKKQAVKDINAVLRINNATLAHPVTGEPCLLVAVGNSTEFGRYALQSRASKKRSHTSRFLSELTPFKLLEAAPRREGFISGR